MRKDVELKISSKQAKQFYNRFTALTGNEFSGRWFQGSLLDEFAISMVDNQSWQIPLKKGRPILARKYVYTYEKFLTNWSSELILVLTDNENKFKNFIKSRFDNDENLNSLDLENFIYDCGLEK